MNCLTPWQCYSKSVEIFLPNLNFTCKESASNWIDFGSQMRGLNSETISICGGILADFCELLHRSSPPKSTCIEKFCMAVTAGLEITAGQRTMSGLIVDLTDQTFVLPVMLTGQNSMVLKMK